MKITYLECVDSTQTYLKNLVKEEKVEIPHAVVANVQSSGFGSRGNAWNSHVGNLFLSFVIEKNELANDVPLESLSIYFAYLLKETLADMNSHVWLKWPNDFYLENLKIGGMITNIVRQNIICGVGLNLEVAPEGFAKLDIKVDKKLLLENFFKKLERKISWKQIFSKYELEFYKNKKFFTHINNNKISLENVSLQDDGSIISNGERIYSIR